MIAEQLKKAVLQAAIQGKLTEQLPGDGDARDLLAEILAEKDRLIKEGKLKKEKPLPAITDDEIPFEIPDNWCWVRLCDIGSIVGGGTPNTNEKINWDNGHLPWITPADMKNVYGKYVCSGERFITNYGLIHSSAQLMPKGSVVFSSRAPIGYLAISKNPLCTNQGFKSVVPFNINMSEFIYYSLMAFTQDIQKLGSGTTFKEVSGSVMKLICIPLPTLTEQQRIVDKLDEILPELEKLSQDEIKLDDLQKSFPQQLKSSLLQAAIQGKLTDQLPDDGSARELLEEIKAEKERLITEGKIRKEKPLPAITEDEIPFDIPETWCWVRLGDICSYIQRGKSPKYSLIKKYPVVAQKCNQWDGFHIEKAQFIDPLSLSKYGEERFLQDEDLMWNSTGLGTLGRMAIYYHKNNPYKIAVADSHVTVIRIFNSLVIPKFVFFYIVGPFIQSIVEDISSGSTKQKELSTSTIQKIIIPLPPLPEQKRIVERLEELLPLCDALE